MEPRAEGTEHLAGTGPHPTSPQNLDKLYPTFDLLSSRDHLKGPWGNTNSALLPPDRIPCPLLQQHRRKTEEPALYKSVQGPAEKHGASTHSI